MMKAARSAVVLPLLGLLSLPLLAQGVYRIVGPDGRVTFSDQPPPTEAQPRTAGAKGTASTTAGGGQLAYELRQVTSRYPVTLYTSKECAPCNSGRNLLNARGIPYTEKTITTAQDAEVLKRLNSDGSMPFLTIGGQQIKGYSDGEWSQYLDAAGYPKQSQLPSGYQRPAPSPLVAVKPVEVATPKSTSTATSPAAVPVAPPVTNPAGIRF